MAYSGSQKTRLGLSGFTRGLYGSFAGKVEAATVVEPIRRIPEFILLPYYAFDGPQRQTLGAILNRISNKIFWATEWDITAVTTAATAAHELVKVDASAATVTVTIPLAADWYDRIFRVKKMDSSANTIILHSQSGESIDGTVCVTVSGQYTTQALMSDGSQWLKV